jgi:hypothetical protein
VNIVKSIGKFAPIDDGVLQIIYKIDRYVVINTFQLCNAFVLDLVKSKSTSIANNTDYDIWYPVLGLPFKAKVK